MFKALLIITLFSLPFLTCQVIEYLYIWQPVYAVMAPLYALLIWFQPGRYFVKLLLSWPLFFIVVNWYAYVLFALSESTGFYALLLWPVIALVTAPRLLLIAVLTVILGVAVYFALLKLRCAIVGEEVDW